MTNGITVVLCLDDKGGMTFFGKRQSRDRVLIENLLSSTEGPIYINNFSSHLFEGCPDRVVICSDPLTECPDGGIAFIENLPLAPHRDRLARIILYKWNKSYPRDRIIDIPLEDFRTEARLNFEGSSHEKITRLTLVK